MKVKFRRLEEIYLEVDGFDPPETSQIPLTQIQEILKGAEVEKIDLRSIISRGEDESDTVDKKRKALFLLSIVSIALTMIGLIATIISIL
jgi:hypothetical protein